MPKQSQPSSASPILTTAGGLAAATSLASRAYAAGNETLKVALVGAGARGTGAAAQALSTDGPVQLWAVADAFEDRLQTSLESLRAGLSGRYDRDATGSLSERINVPPERRFVGLDAYRKAIDSGVDVVIITGPPGFRPAHFEYAVAAGKHVFMEKPVATDPAGVQQVLATARKANEKNLKVGVGLQRHHQPSYKEAIARIHDGMIGDVLATRVYWNGGFPAKTAIPRNGMTELEYQVRNWYFFAWLSGDHICEQHIHNLDVGNWIKQAHPVEAQGMGGREVRTGQEYGHIFDHHAVEFTYADGTKMFSECRQMPGCTNRVAESAHGIKGSADLSTGGASIDVVAGQGWSFPRPRRGQQVNPYQAEHDVLFAAIRNGQPHNEAETGALSTMTAVLGRLATYSGKVVRWDEAINSGLKLTTDAEVWNAPAPITPGPDGYYPVATPGVTKPV